MKCPTPYKDTFSALDEAKRAAKNSSFVAKVYRCPCGGWHLTGGVGGESLANTPSRHRQRQRRRIKNKTPNLSCADPLGEDARKIDQILHPPSTPAQPAAPPQQQHVHRFLPWKETEFGVVEVCKGKKCDAYRVVYPAPAE